MNGIYRTLAGARNLEKEYRKALESWPVPNDHRRVPTSQGDTFVLVCGPEEAPPVVLLHGSSANAMNWVIDAPDWAADFRLYAVDVIGEPGLSAPSRPPLGSEDYARWLDDVFDALDLESAAVVGESLGGWLAVDYASKRSERVSHLTLLCPAGIGRQKWASLVLALLVQPFGAWGRRKAMALMSGTTDVPEFGLDIQRHYRPRMGTFPLFDDSALRQLTMPMLVVLGLQDSIFDSGDTERRLSRTAPHAAFVTLPDAGHFLFPRPTKPVFDFLSRSTRSQTG